MKSWEFFILFIIYEINSKNLLGRVDNLEKKILKISNRKKKTPNPSGLTLNSLFQNTMTSSLAAGIR